MQTFEMLGLETDLVMSIYDNGFVTPTKIQEKSIPVILSGKDLVGKSQTGSGKTLAYLLPTIQKIDRDVFGTQVLIICPTRELSQQVANETKKIISVYDEKLKVVSLNGGVDFDKQIKSLKKGCQIVVGTIGRIYDHIRRRTLKLNTIKTLVLDEADEMLTMGFREDVEKILSLCPNDIQHLLFSATFSTPIKNIISKFLSNPEYVEVESENIVVSTVKQCFMFQKNKIGALEQLIATFKDQKLLIFANTKLMVENLYKRLCKLTKIMYIHGDIRQNERHIAINEFRTGKSNVLLATDVASRGLDIPNVYMVINFELPYELEYYIHRIGRTARAGKQGIALSLVNNSTSNKKMIELAEILKTDITEVTIQDDKLFETKNSYTCQKKPTGLWKSKEEVKEKIVTKKETKNTKPQRERINGDVKKSKVNKENLRKMNFSNEQNKKKNTKSNSKRNVNLNNKRNSSNVKKSYSKTYTKRK